MTKLQENQEYILTKIYEKRPISKYGLELVVNETLDQLKQGEVKWIHTQTDLIIYNLNNNPDMKDIAIFLLSLTDNE